MADKSPLFTARIPVRWGDMDSRQHVNNAVYIRYMEEARILWFNSIGVARGAVGPLVLQNMHTYLKAVEHPATVRLDLYAGAIGRSSLVLEHRLTTEEDPKTLYGEGFCKLVWVNYESNQSIPVPEAMRELFLRHGGIAKRA
ncbi:acyl-CoA thioesterase [Pseudomonas sp. UL073]|uniref:Acyl-CoA thioesterase n=1 Tax=Zestomonas insulae TaxID=2809017 RepID=A0ABS2I8S2_9GAMM|nr:thioesterase family protein [Pseudomonas insulae]MBM7059175.1 acyl-CoA thioesterase [Pseudomonas insulae]